jgi:hypothetical protein
MIEKINALLHFCSALYAVVLAGFLLVFVPRSLFSQFQFAATLVVALATIFVDATAGAKQWRKPPSGYTLSVGSHFLFATGVVAIITFEYLQSVPSSFLSWFFRNNYGFVSLLAALRLLAGGTLLGKEPRG